MSLFRNLVTLPADLVRGQRRHQAGFVLVNSCVDTEKRMSSRTYKTVLSAVTILPSLALAGSMIAQQASAQAAPESSTRAAVNRQVALAKHLQVPKRAKEYYTLIWGVDSLSVKAVESGKLIRFSYTILEPDKAKVFNDKSIEAYLDSPNAHARLVIPSLEKVGQLRQYNTPQPGKSYWMAFSNPRLTVKRGDHVNVVIGHFHADGLIVE
jgi:hypothetical protein